MRRVEHGAGELRFELEQRGVEDQDSARLSMGVGGGDSFLRTGRRVAVTVGWVNGIMWTNCGLSDGVDEMVDAHILVVHVYYSSTVYSAEGNGANKHTRTDERKRSTLL